MNIEEFAAFERLHGAKIVVVDGIYWRQVRPFFFRPLLPLYEYSQGSVRAPRTAVLGGFQHAVPVGAPSNSVLNLRVFERPQDYSLATLDSHRRRMVRVALQHFSIRQISDVNEFKQDAYPVYLSFFQRTGYQYKAERQSRAAFSLWAEKLLHDPKVVVLGGYHAGELGGIGVSIMVEDTLVYVSTFCSSGSLQHFLPNLLLHSIREGATVNPVVRIFVGMRLGIRGLDDFYAQRGCQFVRKPAMFQLNPIAGVILRRWLPLQYAKLSGNLGEGG